MEKSARGSLSTIDAIKVDREHGEKAESFGGSSEPRKLSPIANGVCGELLFPPGIRPRWIKSLLISREAHSPIPEPSSFRLLGSPLYSLSIRLPTSFAPASSHSRPPIAACLSVSYHPSFVFLLFLWIFFDVFRAARETSSACRNEFHVSTDSLIADGLDGRVNRRQKVSSLSSFRSLHRKS